MSYTPAKIISTLFHPLLVPTYGLILLMNLKTHSILAISNDYRYIIVAFVFITTFIIPTAAIFLMLKFGSVNSLQMKSQRERVFPLLIVAIVYYGTYYLLKQASVTGLISFFMIGSTMLVLVTLLINYLTKISLHLIAWGGLLGTILGFAIRFDYNLDIIIITLIFLSGIIATARLKLDAHRPYQVYLGFLFGLIGMISLFLMV